MTVYVLMLDYHYEPSYLRGVYSSLESARAAAELVAQETTVEHVRIYPVTVDALPLDIMSHFRPVDPVAP